LLTCKSVTTIETFIIDVPDGHKFRCSFYKVKKEDPDYVLTVRKLPKIGLDGKVVAGVGARWKALNKNKPQTKEYNKAYYEKRKGINNETEKKRKEYGNELNMCMIENRKVGLFPRTLSLKLSLTFSLLNSLLCLTH